MNDTGMLEAFLAALASNDPTDAPKALFSIFDTLQFAQQRRQQYALSELDRMRIRIVDEEEAEWQKDYYGIKIWLRGKFVIEIILPSIYRGMESMGAFLDTRGVSFRTYFFRVRLILLSVFDMLISQRLMLILGTRSALGALPNYIHFRLPYDDHCPDTNVLTPSRRKGETNILVPDCYFYAQDGYLSHKEHVARLDRLWSNRLNQAIWRGTTTGLSFGVECLERNERIKLARYCAARPDLFDVKISKVAQIPIYDIEVAREKLRSWGIWGDSVDMRNFTKYKFAINIDGNVSAFGFFEKLSLGCCVLAVESKFEQWFEYRLSAWEHFVPIRHDFSDLIEKTEFLIKEPALSERIATDAYKFCIEASFQNESAAFCRDLISHLSDANSFRYDTCQKTIPTIWLLASGISNQDSVGIYSTDEESWNEIETFSDGTLFRWTRRSRIIWKFQGEFHLFRVKIKIPIVNQIYHDYLGRCVLEINGEKVSCSFENQVIYAEIEVPYDLCGEIALITPPPMRPIDAGDSDDDRLLGIAVATNPR